MSAGAITDEFVQMVGNGLSERYGFDVEDVRHLGARLAGDPGLMRRAENVGFAERFTDEHRDTFERLAK